MRRGSGGGRSLWWGVALCTASACGGTLRSPFEQGVSGITCTLTGPPSTTADSAMITFHALGTPPEVCALALVAEALRPWPTPSSTTRWTVHLALTPAGATARRLGSDEARDAIDAGHTLLATEDDDLTAYAAARGALEVTPLPWNRTYLSVSPADELTLGDGMGPDAVRTDARPAEPVRCESAPAKGIADVVPRRTGRILYQAGDRTARELAERLVALTDSGEVTAVGVRVEELQAALHAGDERAYIISVARASQCDAIAALAELAPWLSPHVVQPLIDTRAHAITPRAPRR